MTTSSQPIQLTIPPPLQQYNVSPAAYLAQNTGVDCLVVAALIFATPASKSNNAMNETTTPSSSTTHTPHPGNTTTTAAFSSPTISTPSAEPHLLLVQRSANDSLPNRWEIPGGSCDSTDPTLFQSLAREVFEETGLHVTRIVRKIGPNIRFQTGNPRAKRPLKSWVKLSFEVEVEEVMRADNIVVLDSIPVVLDPKEHQSHMWVSLMNVLSARKGMRNIALTSKENTDVMIEGFRLRGEDEGLLGAGLVAIGVEKA
ncbi:MAG: hypothetical protein M1835_001065 [Candelina submexicana]|nr:MAG: hypothetical protein M1835_001065 [Candelina submexicana]